MVHKDFKQVLQKYHTMSNSLKKNELWQFSHLFLQENIHTLSGVPY